MAYNREGAEVYGLDKALKSGYDELYSTAPDVIDKKMRELDKEIEEKAIEKVNTVVSQVQSEKERKVKEKEFNKDYYIDMMVKSILEQNEQYIGKDVTEEAIKKINNDKETTEEGGIKNVQKAKKAGRPKKVTNAE
jgi:aminoglycoside phosphotransferase family enzyme